MAPTNFLTPAAAVTAAGGPSRMRVQSAAANMQKAVEERASRTGVPVPPYQFLEMIGKGSFGQVFKCKKVDTGQLVAVKIIDVDSSDYHLNPSLRDEAINDFTREIAVLQQLKDARAKNINVIYEALPLHSQLWLVSEYCGGGSVHTLMKASPQGFGLEEKFIIPIAREVAVALRFVHEAGIIHRDLKCGNIFITEDGRVQVGDFGVSGVLEDRYAKRTTIIGTPNWMPPEMFTAAPGFSYGTEVDCWAYGCTVYEMATGRPPMVPTIVPKLMEEFRNSNRVEGGPHSELLTEFLAFCLQENPRDRPNADDILVHPFIAGTSRRYPTSSLIKLLERYLMWEQQGGQRHSLLNPMFGASGPEALPEVDDEDWNFSASDRFSQSFQFNLDQSHLPGTDDQEKDLDDVRKSSLSHPRSRKFMDKAAKSRKEAAILRGEKSMLRVFDPHADPYEFNPESLPTSDLPFRNMAGTEAEQAGNRTTMIDLDAADVSGTQAPNIDLTFKPHRPSAFTYSDDEDDEAATYYSAKRTSNRKTLDWTFPKTATAKETNRKTLDWSFEEAQQTLYEQDETDEADMDDTLPTIKFSSSENPYNMGSRSVPDSPRMSMIDLDLADIGLNTIRPSTASSTAPSFQDDNSAVDPFELERQVQQTTAKKQDSFHESKRASHRPTQSAPTKMVPPQTIPERDAQYNSDGSAHDGRTVRYSQQHRNESMVRDFLEKSVDESNLGPSQLRRSSLVSDEQFRENTWTDYGDYDSNDDFSRARTGLRFPVQFPKYYAPNPEALDFRADSEILRSEMKAQIGSFALALDAARAALLTHNMGKSISHVSSASVSTQATKIDEDSIES